MANQVYYNSYCSKIQRGEINQITGDIRVILLKDTYSFNGNTHLMLSDIISHEAVGTGYTSLGKSLANKQLIVDTVNSRVRYDADDVTWINSTITARYGLVCLYTGDPATSPLMYLIDFDSNRSSGAGDFTIQWDTVGVSYMKGI